MQDSELGSGKRGRKERGVVNQGDENGGRELKAVRKVKDGNGRFKRERRLKSDSITAAIPNGTGVERLSSI